MDDQAQNVELSRTPAETSQARRPSRMKRLLGFGAGAIVLVSLVVGGVLYWLNARHFASTDDAFIDAYTTQMAPRVAGQVTRLLFADNQHVSAGQTLVLIDPSDYQAKLDQAQAQQASAEAACSRRRAQVLVQQSSGGSGRRQRSHGRIRSAAGQAGLQPLPGDQSQRCQPPADRRGDGDVPFRAGQARCQPADRGRRPGPSAGGAGAGAGGRGGAEAGAGEHPRGGAADLLLHDHGAGRGHRHAPDGQCRELRQSRSVAVRAGAGRALGDRQFQGDAACRHPARAGCRSVGRCGAIHRPSTAGWTVSRPAPDPASACCRPRMPPATMSRSSSACR